MSKFVPICQPLSEIPPQRLERFLDVLRSIDKLLVLTGAGISTESGIPDYRSRGVGQYARSPAHRPITIQQFTGSMEYRQRYWARNFVAWPIFNAARCNSTHLALAKWEKSKNFLWHITQNVDGLHREAGAERFTELHGCARMVVCMTCRSKYRREEVQTWISNANKNWEIGSLGELAPDSDIEISPENIASFTQPHCLKCGLGSILKTDVVFFGDTVPREIDEECKEKLRECSGLLVLGSSLTVLSGYRFVYGANLKDAPVLIANAGPTRGDSLAAVTVDAKCSEVVELIQCENIFV